MTPPRKPWQSSRHEPSVTRALDRLAITRGLPRVLLTDNGLEFSCEAMLTWAHERGVTLRLIEPGKPAQNAYTRLLTDGHAGLAQLVAAAPASSRAAAPWVGLGTPLLMAFGSG